ncbi:MAG: serine/threonine-protein kinase [Ardenticatenaceae bacterium]|nr:serine/threonine-protein kinase [Ardenticatenaceae bacterium]
MLLQDEEFVARFRREAQATAQLTHPNIVQVYRTGTAPTGQPYLAMQYINGGTLQQKLLELAAQNQVLTTAVTLILIRQIADALVVAHAAGIVHRDLKPSNVLLHTNGIPVLTDLGIASVSTASRLTHTGNIMGTPHYMSPEQASGTQAIDGRSDIYSLGIILYELLTGSVPFQGDSPVAVLHKHVYEAPPPLSRLRPDLQPATLQLVDICLHKEPGARWADAAALRQAIDAALAAEQHLVPGMVYGSDAIPLNQTITRHNVVQPLTPLATMPPNCGGTPPWVWGAAAVLVVLLLAIVVAIVYPRLREDTQSTVFTPTRIPTATVALPVVAEVTAAQSTLTPLPTLTALPPTPTTTNEPTETPITPTPLPTAVSVSGPGQVVFQSDRDGDYDIYIMDEYGGGQRPLTANSATDQYPRAAPDGTQIAFQSDRDGNWEIYVLDLDSGAERRLTYDAGEDRLPTWSPDSQQIAFLSDRDGDFEIYVMDVDGGNLRQVTFNDLRVGHPSWSVDNQFAFNAGTLNAATWELYTVALDGGASRQLTDNSIGDWSPEWSPDGRQILFLSLAVGNDPALFVMNADGSGRRILFNSEDYEWGQSWTTDGRILFTRDRDNIGLIYIMNDDGSGVRLLTERGSYPSWVAPQSLVTTACAWTVGTAVTAGPEARLWSQPNVQTGQIVASLAEGAELTINDGPVTGPIRLDTDDQGQWWLVTAVAGGDIGWIWQERLQDCALP